MPHSIACSTKILALAIAPFLFIFVGIIFEFAMGPGGYIFVSPKEEEIHYSSQWRRCTHSAAHSSKRFKSLFTSCYYAKVVVDLEKSSKKFSCVIVLIMRQRILKFQFVFSFNQYL